MLKKVKKKVGQTDFFLISMYNPNHNFSALFRMYSFRLYNHFVWENSRTLHFFISKLGREWAGPVPGPKQFGK